MQAPSPSQKRSLTSLALPSIICKAPSGQLGMHFPQPVHFFSSMTIIFLLTKKTTLTIFFILFFFLINIQGSFKDESCKKRKSNAGGEIRTLEATKAQAI